VDTVKIIKEIIHLYLSGKATIEASAKLLSASKNDYDCNKEICPENIDK